MKTVGFIGVGQMGGPLAKNLLRAGFPLAAYDLDGEKIQALTKLGARPAAGVADLTSQSDVVMTVLTYPNVVEEVVLGRGGILDGLKENAVLIEASSIDHTTSMEIAERVEARGGRYIEAVLMGRPWEIELKELLFLTAGKEDTVKECAPLFDAMGRKNIYVGSVGRAKLLKIAFAMLHGSESTILYEVLAWSLQNAIPQEAFLEVLHDRDPRRARDIGEILRGKLEKVPSWTAKDVHHAMEVAEEREIPMPIMSAVNAVIKLAKRENREGYTFTGMMWKFYEKTLGRI